MIMKPFNFQELKENNPLDIWALIDTYFRDNSYYKSKTSIR